MNEDGKHQKKNVKKFHEPCSALSVKKVEASAAAEPIDPKDLVQNWVKTVDTVTSELENESKIFGNDQEFYHVQRDPIDVAGFRDSGYYDGILDSKQPLDSKPGLTALDESIKVKLQEKEDILKEMKGKNPSDIFKDDVTKVKYTDIPNQTDKHEKISFKTNKERPALLQGEMAEIKQVSTEKYGNVETPSSIGQDHSTSDSEYQSGQEDLSLNLDSPTTPNTDVMESSVDTGEVFPSESQTDDKNDVNKAAENCNIS